VRDPLDIIASGPTLPSKVSNAEVLHILEKFSLTEQIPASALSHLQAQDSLQQLSPSEDKRHKIPLVNGDEYSHVRNVIIGNNRVATEAAADTAQSLGYNSLVWSHQIQGEARLLGEAYARIIHELLEQTSPTIGVLTREYIKLHNYTKGTKHIHPRSHGTADLYHSAPLIVNYVFTVLKRTPQLPWSSDIP